MCTKDRTGWNLESDDWKAEETADRISLRSYAFSHAHATQTYWRMES